MRNLLKIDLKKKMNFQILNKINLKVLFEQIKIFANDDELNLKELVVREFLGNHLFLIFEGKLKKTLIIAELDQNHSPKLIHHTSYNHNAFPKIWEDNGSIFYS